MSCIQRFPWGRSENLLTLCFLRSSSGFPFSFKQQLAICITFSSSALDSSNFFIKRLFASMFFLHSPAFLTIFWVTSKENELALSHWVLFALFYHDLTKHAFNFCHSFKYMLFTILLPLMIPISQFLILEACANVIIQIKISRLDFRYFQNAYSIWLISFFLKPAFKYKVPGTIRSLPFHFSEHQSTFPKTTQSRVVWPMDPTSSMPQFLWPGRGL